MVGHSNYGLFYNYNKAATTLVNVSERESKKDIERKKEREIEL